MGLDYESLPAAELTYSSSSAISQSFDVTILSDNLTELREFFECILTGYFVRDGGGVQVALSSQERSRVSFNIDRAQVFINDTDSKYIKYFAQSAFT